MSSLEGICLESMLSRFSNEQFKSLYNTLLSERDKRFNSSYDSISAKWSDLVISNNGIPYQSFSNCFEEPYNEIILKLSASFIDENNVPERIKIRLNFPASFFKNDPKIKKSIEVIYSKDNFRISHSYNLHVDANDLTDKYMESFFLQDPLLKNLLSNVNFHDELYDFLVHLINEVSFI